MPEYDDDLLKQGIFHFKSGEFALARRYFERALETADDLQTRAQASLHLSQVVDDPAEKRRLLEETLAVDMGNAAARRLLATLDGKLDPAQIVNPDALPVSGSETQAVPAVRITCPQCGGCMLYAPSGAWLECENCGFKQALGAAALGLPVAEQDFFIAMANGKGFRKTTSLKTFQCQGCGARFMLAPSEISATCAYCGAVHVVATGQVEDVLEPDAIVPMAFDQARAALQLTGWLKKRHLSPAGSGMQPRGVYLPAWVFELGGVIPWKGRVTRDKCEVPISGESPVFFTNICVPAVGELSQVFARLLPGYHLAEAVAYDVRFLAGWPARIHETAMSDAALEARQQVVRKIVKDLQTTQGNVIDLGYSTSSVSINSYRLVLLPAWVMEYSQQGQVHQAVVNGQTGSVEG
jgi:hypothetical protein